MPEAPDYREDEDCPSAEVCEHGCDQHPKPGELTEAEMDSLLSVYQSPSFRRWPRLLAVVRGVVAAREAAARREALLEAAALVEAEVADAIEARVRAARGDVRCLDCNLRYEERQEYGCHTSGRAHDYDESDFAGAEEIERSNPVEYVTLSVADLRAALAEPERDEESGR